MTPSSREIPKAIAEFGRRQFQETGARAVEVLRVKASTIRKHFRQLSGIMYSVAVISLDRVRIYFFDLAGRLLIGENIEPSMYAKLRKTSKLITRFEKPREPTEEELRMEATEEVRQILARAIRRVSRFLAIRESPFPALFVEKDMSLSKSQSFGVVFEKEKVIFAEGAVRSHWSEGVVLRTAFLLQLDDSRRRMDFASCVGNAIALALLKKEQRQEWSEIWLKHTSPDLQSFVRHFIKHIETYENTGFRWIFSLLSNVSSETSMDSWQSPLKTIHETIEVSLGTEEYYTINRFCKTLQKPKKLVSKKSALNSIHLTPRAFCNPLPLGLEIKLSQNPASVSESQIWARIEYLTGAETKSLIINTAEGRPFESFEYVFSVEDIFPKPAGILSHGKSVLHWALSKLNIQQEAEPTFHSELTFHDDELPKAELAVLERLCNGGLRVLADSLIGSPQRIESLIAKNHLVLLPDFNHLGINHDFVLIGNPRSVCSAAFNNSIECSIFYTDKLAYAIVAAPSAWRYHLIQACAHEKLAVYPIVATWSINGLLRHENIFPADMDPLTWF